MSTGLTRQQGLEKLRDVLAFPKLDLARVAGRSVRKRYQPVFTPDNLPTLTEADFLSFLNFKNNQHWMGLHRKGPEICSDMNRLQTALGVLLDESRRSKRDSITSSRVDVLRCLGWDVPSSPQSYS